MSSMNQSASLQPLFERFTENFYDAGCPVVRKEFDSFTQDFLRNLPEVEKISTRASTKPGEEFQSQLCRCRVWNNGLAKQCSFKPKEEGICSFHFKKIEVSSGDWALGFYDEEKPSTYLCDYGKKESGAELKWKSEESEDEEDIIRLKEAYKSAFGKSARGPKASDPDWLKSKMDELSSSDDDKTELELMKEEYKKVFGKSPKGPKTNDMEWLKSKIDAETSDDEKTDLELMKEEYTKVLGKSPKGPKTNDMDWLKSKIDEAKDPVPEDSDDDSSDEDSSDDDSSDDDSDEQSPEDYADSFESMFGKC